MKITLKLYATLGDFLPDNSRQNMMEVEIAEDATPNQVIDQFKVPRELAHLVLLNGRYVEPEQRDQSILQSNDALAIWPPVAGG